MISSEPLLVFTQEEIALIGHTADALSAYMGKPVIAEIMSAEDTGAEWVAFGIPLGIEDEIDEDSMVVIHLGGPGARYAGNRGGLDDDETYSCECLWIIQLSDDEAARYVKVDPLTQDFVASNMLSEILPFDVSDDAFTRLPDADADDESNEVDTAEDEAETRRRDQLLNQLQPPSGRLH